MKTLNPFKIIGSYLGLLAGYLLYLKEIDAFGFVFRYVFYTPRNILESNLIGGFIVGYIIYIFLRAIFNISRQRSSSRHKKEIKH